MAEIFRCGDTKAGHDPHFIQVHRAKNWQPVTIVKVEGHEITLRFHGGDERVVRNHDTPRVERLLAAGHTGCWINGAGNLLSIDRGPGSSSVVSVTEDDLGECGPDVGGAKR